ncbi:tyrosine-protein kinase receptor Tie-1-like isoform X1 [Branchiostoma lanceolatum]|uniref:tyrosine-protein kinase receptor Tie-1-like isoform X1 n=1 Tax=Branchiostoma lanceolatum TaxID=7740 RepID=UPI0034519F40
MYKSRSEALFRAATLTLLFFVVRSAGKWTADPTFARDSIRLTWDDTGVDDSFVKYVVQMHQVNGTIRNCSDVYLPWKPKIEKIPIYELREATFNGLLPGTFYCRNCTIVTTNGTKSCGELQAIRTVGINATDASDRYFSSTSVTNSTITVTWANFTEQIRRTTFAVIYFSYYKLDIFPREIDSNTPQVYYNETDMKATFFRLTPGKEYQIQLGTVGINSRKVKTGFPLGDSMIDYRTAAIITTDPSSVEKLSIVTAESTSVTLNLIPPTEGFVDLFQIQATSSQHTSPLIDVSFSEKTRRSVRTTLSNLQPKTAYNLSVVTVANGRRGQARFVTFRTGAVPIDAKLVGSVTAVLVVALMAAAFCAVRIVKRLRYKLDPTQLFREVLEDIVGSEKMEPWLKDRKDLFLEELIGEGEFGHVRRGVLREEGQQAVIVAAKTLRVDRANEITYRDFAKEASLLVEVNDDGGHVNIVSLIGLVIDGVKKKDPRYILVEYAEPGEFLWYLVSIQNNRHHAGIPPGLGRQLTEVAIDIARGMLELKRRRITHRDLACRNIVLSSPGGQAGRLVAKISDFGLARDVYVTTQYMRHPLTNLLLPIKWMAIESLIEGVYSCKSDMWGFGVVLWEIATLGGTPYPEVCGYETLVTRLRRGYRLQKPNGCSDELYELMNLCWLDDPDVRPTPDVMEDRLEQLLEQNKAFFHEI